MRLIPLQAVPNQSLSFTLDENRWEIRIAQAVTSMIMDIRVNDEVVILGTRIPGDDFIIPYRYLGERHGNLMLTTQDDRLPDWNRFGLTQQLFYWSPEDMTGLPGSSPDVNSFRVPIVRPIPPMTAPQRLTIEYLP